MEKVLWFIMKNIRKIVSYLQSVILLLIGITTAINIINCIYIKIQFVLLEENQLLYIYFIFSSGYRRYFRTYNCKLQYDRFKNEGLC